MSNRVKDLYNNIIDQVVKETRSDIEESGEDPAVPEMLRDAWKRRLSEMKVTREPIGTPMAPPSRGLGSDIVARQPSNLNISGLRNLPMQTDLSYYGQSSSDVKQKIDTSQFTSQLKTDINLDNMPKSASPNTAVNPLVGNPNQQLPPHLSSATLSPQLREQINIAMENHKNVPQNDGPQDEELNSDLDDSEDELNSNDEDEDTDQTQIMLCLYEKVHKVKTRWKYILKDGIANINGLDYVFNRATGESEW